MSVTVSIPTILRPQTGGQKRVTASGDTLGRSSTTSKRTTRISLSG